MRVLIYQVLGRLSEYSTVSYEIDRFTKENVNLSSEALYSFYAKDDHNPEIVYVCPNSLYSGQNISEYLANPVLVREKFHNEISNISTYKNFDVLIINAIGNYQINREKVSFKNTPGNVSIRLFLDMLKRIKEYDGRVKLIADISTGYNIYIASMLEALRAVIVYDKLRNGITEKKVDASYAVSEPVAGMDGKLSRKIFVNEYDVKAFFILPIKPQDLNKLCKLEHYVECDPKTKEKISRETKDKRKKLKILLENLVKTFNSIRFNVPLALYSGLMNLNQDANDLENKLADFMLEQIKPVFNEGIVTSISLKWKDLFNLFYSLALFKWLSNEIGDLQGRNKVSITELEEKMNQVYNKLGLSLNKRFLKRDLDEIWTKKDMIRKKWTCLKKVFQEEIPEECTCFQKEGGKKSPDASDPKRNFFAHSGLERTMVEVRKYREKIELRYVQGQLDTICKWLFNPEE